MVHYCDNPNVNARDRGVLATLLHHVESTDPAAALLHHLKAPAPTSPVTLITIARLSKLVGVGERSLHTAIQRLEAAGYITRERQRDAGRFGPVMYSVTIDNMTTAPPTARLRSVPDAND